MVIHNFKKLLMILSVFKSKNKNKYLIQLNNFKIIKLIAHGSFSSVYLIQKIKNLQQYVAKVNNTNIKYVKNQNIIENEIEIMINLNHPTIIKFKGYSLTDFHNENNITIIMDFKENGSLSNIIQKAQHSLADYQYDNTARQIILIGVSCGMMYLHDHQIIHRDLKPGNILLDENYHPFISDFGLSKSLMYDHISSQFSLCGTLIYMAPEVISEGRYSFKSDVYSFGIVMYEIVTESFPYPALESDEMTEDEFKNKVVNEFYRPSFHVPVKKSIKNLIENCWSTNPESRPTFKEIFRKLTLINDNDSSCDCCLDGVIIDKIISYVESIVDDDFYDSLKNHKNEFISIEHFNSLCLREQQSEIQKIIDKQNNKIFIDINNLLIYLMSFDSSSKNTKFFEIKSKKPKISLDQTDELKQIILHSKAAKKIFLNDSFDSDYFIQLIKPFDQISIEMKYPSKKFKNIYEKVKEFKEAKKVQIKMSLFITKIEETDETFQSDKSIDFVVIDSSVTSISNRFFYECSQLKEVTISDTMKSIGELSFWGCSSLSFIDIPSSVTSIGSNAFEGCSSLVEFAIPPSVTIINSGTFCRCSSLKRVTIPASVTKIGRNSFRECSSLKQIAIPSSVILIGDNAFAGCRKLLEVSIPSTMISLGMHLFRNCTSLTQITIPFSIPSIRRYSFECCSSLEEVVMHSSIREIEDFAFDGCSSLKDLTIPHSVVSIGRSAFSRCVSLFHVTIPHSVIVIDASCFWGCLNLKFVSFPSSLTEIGPYAFSGCSSLIRVEIPSSVNSIGAATFLDCCSLKEVSIHSSIQSIESSTFCGCFSLKSFDIPSSVTSINECAFYGCSSLRNVSVPSSVTQIGDCAFYDCSNLTQIRIPSSVTNIGESAFPSQTRIVHY